MNTKYYKGQIMITLAIPEEKLREFGPNLLFVGDAFCKNIFDEYGIQAKVTMCHVEDKEC